MTRAAWLPWLLVAALSAGCTTAPGDDAGAGPIALDTPQVWPAVAEPRLVGRAGNGETSLILGTGDHAGTMLTCDHGGFGSDSPTWASTDAGKTWAAVDIGPNVVVAGDCDVAITDDGTWAITYDTLYSAAVATSTDQGASWFVHYATALPVGGVDRPWLVADGDDLVLVYQSVAAAEPAVDMIARSTDGGLTWIQGVVNVARPPDRPQDIMGDPFIGQDGEIFIPMQAGLWATGLLAGYDAPPKWAELAVSTDRGLTWTLHDVAGPLAAPLQFPVATQAGDGTLYFTVQHLNGSRTDIGYHVSDDAGVTWSAWVPIAVDVPFPSVVDTAWVDGRADGTATAGWLAQAENETGELGWAPFMARLDGTDVVWVEQVGPALPDGGIGPEFAQLRHDADGVAWMTYPIGGPSCESLAAGGTGDCVMVVSAA